MFTSIRPPSRYSATIGRQSIHTSFSPALKPLRTRSILLAPMFCAVKLDMPLPSVVSEVITRLLSLTDAE